MLILYKYNADRLITFELAQYAENGNLYVGMICHNNNYPEPWSNLTVNLSVKCAPNRAYIDINNNGNEIIDWLEKNNLGFTTGNLMPSGWCVYPEFEFNMEKLMKHTTENYLQGE